MQRIPVRVGQDRTDQSVNVERAVMAVEFVTVESLWQKNICGSRIFVAEQGHKFEDGDTDRAKLHQSSIVLRFLKHNGLNYQS